MIPESIPNTPSLETWQLWSAIRKSVGDIFLQKLYKLSPRQFQRWSADPKFADDISRNPIDRIETIMDRLDEIGKGYVADAILERLASRRNCEVRCLDECMPDKADIRDECLDDHPPLQDFHTSILCKAPLRTVKDKRDAALREIDETYQAYRISMEGGR